MLRPLLAAAGIVLATSTMASAACNAPFGPDRTFFLGISPSDGPLDVFCRIQAFPGEYTVNILFEKTDATGAKADRSFPMTFMGQGRELGPEVFREMMQSMVPTAKGPVYDDKGQPFARQLLNVTQGAAVATPNPPVVNLSVPPETNAGMALMFWQPIYIRVRPVTVAGVPFTLAIKMVPSPGRLLYETMDAVPGLVVDAWKGRLNLGDYFNDKNCSQAIPACKNLPDIVRVHFAMQVENVTLEARGDNLSNAAETILRSMDASTRGEKSGTDPASFDPVKGTAKREIVDKPFAVTIEANSMQGKAYTNQIRLTYEQRQGENLSWAERMSILFKERQETMIRGMSGTRR